MALSFSRTMRAETRLITHSLNAVQSEQLAQSGIWLAVQSLVDSRAAQQSDVALQQKAEMQGKLSISIQDQNGLMDLNYAPPDLIQTALTGLGWSNLKAEAVTHQIIDWRDKDHDKQASGAEDIDYRAEGRAYGAKDAAFNTVEELRLLPAVSESDFRKISGFFTVYSQQRSINPTLAPTALLMALTQSGASDRDSLVKDLDGTASWLNQRSGRAFSIVSSASVNNSESQIEAVILRNPDQQRQYAVLSWRRHGRSPL
jgi:general secretion pathway protein K